MLFFAGTKRVHNNIVYNEYISHREHIHMNSTQWETLTDFTKWLGREGKRSMHWTELAFSYMHYTHYCAEGWVYKISIIFFFERN